MADLAVPVWNSNMADLRVTKFKFVFKHFNHSVQWSKTLIFVNCNRVLVDKVRIVLNQTKLGYKFSDWTDQCCGRNYRNRRDRLRTRSLVPRIACLLNRPYRRCHRVCSAQGSVWFSRGYPVSCWCLAWIFPIPKRCALPERKREFQGCWPWSIGRCIKDSVFARNIFAQ